jgi:hypothetical protein
MPGSSIPTVSSSAIPTTTTVAKINYKQVNAALAILNGKSSVNQMIGALNSILSEVGLQSLAAQTQRAFSTAMQNFDGFARRLVSNGNLTKSQISAIHTFFYNLQNSISQGSSLGDAGVASYVPSAVQYWKGQSQK